MKKLTFLILLVWPVFCLSTINGAAWDNFYISVTSDKSVYKNTETITMALTVLNQNSAPLKAIFNSARIYDFYLYNGNQLIWKWSEDKMFAMMITDLTFEPEKPVTYMITFNQKLASGKPLEAGRYKLVAALCTAEKEYLSEPLTIEIKN